MIKQITLPTGSGQTTDETTVTRIIARIGDKVKRGDVLLEVESDKAVLPIESFANGYVVQIHVKELDKIDAGSPLMDIGDESDLAVLSEGVSEPRMTEPPTASSPTGAVAPITGIAAGETSLTASPESAPEPPKTAAPSMPNAKRLAAELGVDLGQVTPSNGMFIKAADVRSAAPGPGTVAAEAGNSMDLPMPPARKSLARRWEESAKIPAFSVSIDVGLAAADRLISVLDNGIGYAEIFMLATARASAKFPPVRVVYEDGGQKLSPDTDIALARYAETGTLSMVVKSVQSKGLARVAAENAANAAAIGKSDPAPAGGSHITLHDLSAFGTTACAPLIGLGQSCALSLGGVRTVPRFANGAFVPERVLTLTGSFDQRLFENNAAAAFLGTIKAYVEEPGLMLS